MTNQTVTRTRSAIPRGAPNRRTDLIGYTVGAVGGDVGFVDPATADVSPRDLVVRIGRWPVRQQVVVPAGAVNCVDHQSRRVCLQGDRKMVNAAPRLDPGRPVASHDRWYRTSPRPL